MKAMHLALVLLASTAATPVFAADIPALSKVDAVTVFPRGAEVTRTAEATIAAGEHSLIFDGLPGDLLAQTIRVEGDALGEVEIGSVDSKLVYLSKQDADGKRKALEDQIQSLQDERGVLDQTIADAEYQKSLMQQLASGAFTAPPKDGGGKVFDAAQLGQLLDLVGGKLNSLSKLVLDSRTRQRDIDDLVNDLQNRIAELAPDERAHTQVIVHLSAPAPVSGTFRIKYRIDGAGWQPIYDARLTSPDKNSPSKIELVRRAAVEQSTTEDWQNVALTLSTARPIGATAAPNIQPQLIGGFNDGLAKNQYRRDQSVLEAPAPASEAVGGSLATAQDSSELKTKKVEQMEAQVEIAGFQALYAIPGRVTVDNTGTAKYVRIATSEVTATLSAQAVPKLDPNAYLTAAFTLNGDTPLLPGTAMLYRDGVFMGQGYMPLLSPGEESKLGFGADDLIKVKRVEVKSKRGEEGLLTTSNTDEHAYDITVKNLHDFAIPVTVLDQMPYSTQEDITVETLPGMTPPTEKDFDKKRGVMAWSFDLDPQADRLVKHGYKVTWPKDMQVGMNVN